MNSTPLGQIEQVIGQLTDDERLLLIERLAHGLRDSSKKTELSLQAQLAEMAADPDIRRELDEIAREFAATDMDGLE